MALEESFVYTVHPRTPIRNIVKGKVIFKAENLSLTKQEALECLKYGAVYRKFYTESSPERVTPSNIDRLHRPVHLSQAEYKALLNSKKEEQAAASGLSANEGSGVVGSSITEEIPVEELLQEEEPVVEEETVAAPVEEEEYVEEKKAEEEQLPTDEDLTSAETTVENEPVEEEEVSESPREETEVEEVMEETQEEVPVEESDDVEGQTTEEESTEADVENYEETEIATTLVCQDLLAESNTVSKETVKIQQSGKSKKRNKNKGSQKASTVPETKK